MTGQTTRRLSGNRGGPLPQLEPGGGEAVPCRRCGHSTLPGARFCGHCGLRLPSCDRGAPALAEALVCGQRFRERGKAWYRLALRAFREAGRRSATSIEPILEVARTYHLMGRPKRARRWYRRVLSRRPDCFEAWQEGAATLSRYSHFRRAVWLSRALALKPADRAVADAFDHDFGKLSGWQRWWIERSVWRFSATHPPSMSAPS